MAEGHVVSRSGRCEKSHAWFFTSVIYLFKLKNPKLKAFRKKAGE